MMTIIKAIRDLPSFPIPTHTLMQEREDQLRQAGGILLFLYPRLKKVHTALCELTKIRYYNQDEYILVLRYSTLFMKFLRNNLVQAREIVELSEMDDQSERSIESEIVVAKWNSMALELLGSCLVPEILVDRYHSMLALYHLRVVSKSSWSENERLLRMLIVTILSVMLKHDERTQNQMIHAARFYLRAIGKIDNRLDELRSIDRPFTLNEMVEASGMAFRLSFDLRRKIEEDTEKYYELMETKQYFDALIHNRRQAYRNPPSIELD
jgi:hypothetical protein